MPPPPTRAPAPAPPQTPREEEYGGGDEGEYEDEGEYADEEEEEGEDYVAPPTHLHAQQSHSDASGIGFITTYHFSSFHNNHLYINVLSLFFRTRVYGVTWCGGRGGGPLPRDPP